MTKRWVDLLAYVQQNPMSSELEIVRGVGLKKTPYSHRILTALVEDGRLRRYWDDTSVPARFVYEAQENPEVSQ